MKNYSATVKSENIEEVFFFQNTESDITLSSNKVKFKNFTGLIHNPLGSESHEVISSRLGVCISDSFILKGKSESEFGSDSIADNTSQLNNLKAKISEDLALNKSEFEDLIVNYVNHQIDINSLSSNSLKQIDRYVIGVCSLPTSEVILKPKNSLALKGVAITNESNDMVHQLLSKHQIPSCGLSK